MGAMIHLEEGDASGSIIFPGSRQRAGLQDDKDYSAFVGHGRWPSASIQVLTQGGICGFQLVRSSAANTSGAGARPAFETKPA